MVDSLSSHLGGVRDDGCEGRELEVHLLPPPPLSKNVLMYARARSPPAFRFHRRRCAESPGSHTGVAFLLALGRREAQLLRHAVGEGEHAVAAAHADGHRRRRESLGDDVGFADVPEKGEVGRVHRLLPLIQLYLLFLSRLVRELVGEGFGELLHGQRVNEVELPEILVFLDSAKTQTVLRSSSVFMNLTVRIDRRILQFEDEIIWGTAYQFFQPLMIG